MARHPTGTDRRTPSPVSRRSPRSAGSSWIRRTACTRRSARSSRASSTTAACTRTRAVPSARRAPAPASGCSLSSMSATCRPRRRKRTAIGREIAALLGETITGAGGERPISAGDVIAVTPYNAQVHALAQLPCPKACGSARSIRFQGQEAPIVFFSMAKLERRGRPTRRRASCSPATASTSPLSRAQSLAILVCSPARLGHACDERRRHAPHQRALPLRRHVTRRVPTA